MARWMRDHTTAGTNPKETSSSSSGEPHLVWSKDRRRYHQRDAFIWSVGITVTIVMIMMLMPRISDPSRHETTKDLSRHSSLPSSAGDLEESDVEDAEETVEEGVTSRGLDQAQGDDERRRH